MEMYKTNELIKKANVSRETIRYYENRGLICPVDRTASGYKLYDEGTKNKIIFIKQVQKLSFSLKEIEELLARLDESKDPCEELIRAVDDKMNRLNEKKLHLRKVKKALENYCPHKDKTNESVECPIIKDFVELDIVSGES